MSRLTVATVRLRLDVPATAVDDVELQGIIDGQEAAQATRCEFNPVTVPADLDLALMRRVAKAVALRSLPLGMVTGLGDGGTGSARVGYDAEIRALEQPYKRLFAG
jgi:hypothetical protein